MKINTLPGMNFTVNMSLSNPPNVGCFSDLAAALLMDMYKTG